MPTLDPSSYIYTPSGTFVIILPLLESKIESVFGRILERYLACNWLTTLQDVTTEHRISIIRKLIETVLFIAVQSDLLFIRSCYPPVHRTWGW